MAKKRRQLNKKRLAIVLVIPILIIALMIWGIGSLISHAFGSTPDRDKTAQTADNDNQAQKEAAKKAAEQAKAEKEKRIETLKNSEPGQVVDLSGLSPDEVKSLFAIAELTQEQIDAMTGIAYTDAQDFITPDQLRYLKVVHKNEDGKDQIGELMVNQSIASEISEIFQELYDAGYVMTQIRLPNVFGSTDESNEIVNNTNAFSFRLGDTNGMALRSEHSLGIGIDINPLYNPQVIDLEDGSVYVSPNCAEAYMDRTQDFPMKIDENDTAYKIFTAHGFEWGGEWDGRNDYMHFEIGFDHNLVWYDEYGDPLPGNPNESCSKSLNRANRDQVLKQEQNKDQTRTVASKKSEQ